MFRIVAIETGTSKSFATYGDFLSVVQFVERKKPVEFRTLEGEGLLLPLGNTQFENGKLKGRRASVVIQQFTPGRFDLLLHNDDEKGRQYISLTTIGTLVDAAREGHLRDILNVLIEEYDMWKDNLTEQTRFLYV
jgi:hypothetical protein